MTKSLTDLVQGVKKTARGIAAAGLIGATMFFSNGCGTPPIEKPKPTAILTVEKSQVQSGQENKIEVDGTIGGDPLVDKISKYYLRGPVDFGASLPLQTNIPVDVFLTYFTNEQMNIPLEAQVESNKGVLSDKVYASYQVNPKIVEDYINLSGVIEDSETDSPLAGAKVRCYRADKTFITEVTADEDGFWTADWLKYEGDDKIIIQAGKPPESFVRTTSIPNEDKSNVLVRAVPNDLEGFVEFAQEVWGSLPARFDSTGFQGFKILTQNPTGNGTFTQQQAEYLQSLVLDPSNKIDEFLNASSYPVIIDPSEPYTPGSRNIHVIPDTDIPIGEAYLEDWGPYSRVAIGGSVRMNPTNISNEMLEHVLKHEAGHLTYPSHPTTTESIMHTPPTQMDYQPLDLKGTCISNEPTFIGTAGGLYPNSIDYRKNILKTEFGLEGTVGY
ncbi:MAG TPA: hypothetical protein PLK34_03260 [Candidatus Pacearchaeota archaeon]|nr:hypothetical protein [Candidatus Pacearchaeota archaeon]